MSCLGVQGSAQTVKQMQGFKDAEKKGIRYVKGYNDTCPKCNNLSLEHFCLDTSVPQYPGITVDFPERWHKLFYENGFSPCSTLMNVLFYKNGIPLNSSLTIMNVLVFRGDSYSLYQSALPGASDRLCTPLSSWKIKETVLQKCFSLRD